MTARRILAVELRCNGRVPVILTVVPPADPGDVFRGTAYGPYYSAAKSIAMPTALATFESLLSQLIGAGWDELPSAEELMKLAKEG